MSERGLLLRALAEELKLPLVQIARSAELGELQTIEATTANALRLIDGYLLTTQGQLAVEPVSVTATMYDVAQDLRELSKLYDSTVSIRVQRAPGQAMADRQALRAALLSLGHLFVTGGFRSKDHTVTLWASQTEEGIVTGVLSRQQVSAEDLQQARALYGRAGQPAGGFTQSTGLGLYVADQLFEAMDSTLKVVTRGGQSGLVAVLPKSQQLALL